MDYAYYMLRIRNGEFSYQLHYSVCHDDVYVSAHTKACTMSKAACLESLELATSFAKFIGPTMVKRHGERTELEIVDCRASSSKQLANAVRRDSQVARARILTVNSAPNVAVDLTVLDRSANDA